MIKHLLVAAAVAASATGASAQSTPGVDSRQAKQQQRIDKGVKSGELNAAEASRLQQGQANVQKMENKAKADGVVTKAERQKLHQAQDRQSARIAKQKHDAHTAK